jgi:hypothetical protein
MRKAANTPPKSRLTGRAHTLTAAVAARADVCNTINDAYATGLIRQRITASLGAQAMSVRQQRARDRG